VAADFETATGGKYSAAYFRGGFKKIDESGNGVTKWE
jgi:hypothetical protein